MAMAISACGGGEPSTETSNAGGNAPAKETAAGGASEPRLEFAGKGENGELAKAGTEASDAEREAASRVVEENLRARVENDFRKQCETLAPRLVEELEKRNSNGSLGSGCESILKGLAKQLPGGKYLSPMGEPLAALVVNGERGFAFFHGISGADFVVPMEKAAGNWKVASVELQQTP
jgi:hypothetical protein